MKDLEFDVGEPIKQRGVLHTWKELMASFTFLSNFSIYS